MTRICLFGALLVSLSGLAAQAQSAAMPGMDMGPPAATQAKGAQSPSTKAFQDADMKMHKAMAISYTGNPDVDFVRGMIPHHAGAVDMAKIELAYGKDPQLRKLAGAIIKAQQDEIAFMNQWLAAHPK